MHDLFGRKDNMEITESSTPKAKSGLGFRAFRLYARLFYSYLYYRKFHSIGLANIPQDCPLMIVSDHQNGGCDPLAIIFSVRSRKERKIKSLARADFFNIPFAGGLARWIGLLPTYRLSYEGEASLANNAGTFEEVENELLQNGTILLFPEAGHQDKHWLGWFSLAYLRILFETAKKSHFEKELFVLPSCNHYSDYSGWREEALVKFGTPISIAPYYELYRSKPRTAQRQVNALVKQQISDMMLNITDLDNYTAIDFLRNTYGVRYAEKNGFKPNKLPDKLTSDKQLFAKLEEQDGAYIRKIYDDTRILIEKTRQLHLNDLQVGKKYVSWRLFPEGIFLLGLFPVFALAALSNLLVFLAPVMVKRKIKDAMLHSTVDIAVNILITFPLTIVLLAVFWWCFTKNPVISIAGVVCMPFLSIFACRYHKAWKRWKSGLYFHCLAKRQDIRDYTALRTQIFESLDKILT
jgi:1-acyl-sn-glycerol-3-phosphate acyltransferase